MCKLLLCQETTRLARVTLVYQKRFFRGFQELLADESDFHAETDIEMESLQENIQSLSLNINSLFGRGPCGFL